MLSVRNIIPRGINKDTQMCYAMSEGGNLSEVTFYKFW